MVIIRIKTMKEKQTDVSSRFKVSECFWIYIKASECGGGGVGVRGEECLPPLPQSGCIPAAADNDVSDLVITGNITEMIGNNWKSSRTERRAELGPNLLTQTL